MTEPAALELADVHKRFHTPRGEIHVLRGIDLVVRAGEFVALTGPSGSGKTTLLTLAGLLDRPTAGTISIRGRIASWDRDDEIHHVRAEGFGMVFQHFNLLTRRTVLDNVLFRYRYLPGQRDGREQRARATLASLGIADLADTPVRLLSGGEMQRVGLARALVHPPRCLLADEPTGNLDAHTARDVMDSLKRLNNDGMTILMVTHNDSLLPYCTRHVSLRDGRVKERGVA